MNRPSLLNLARLPNFLLDDIARRLDRADLFRLAVVAKAFVSSAQQALCRILDCTDEAQTGRLLALLDRPSFQAGRIFGLRVRPRFDDVHNDQLSPNVCDLLAGVPEVRLLQLECRGGIKLDRFLQDAAPILPMLSIRTLDLVLGVALAGDWWSPRAPVGPEGAELVAALVGELGSTLVELHVRWKPEPASRPLAADGEV